MFPRMVRAMIPLPAVCAAISLSSSEKEVGESVTTPEKETMPTGRKAPSSGERSLTTGGPRSMRRIRLLKP